MISGDRLTINRAYYIAIAYEPLQRITITIKKPIITTI